MESPPYATPPRRAYRRNAMDYPRIYAGQDTLTPGTQRTTDLFLAALQQLPASTNPPLLIADIACGKGVTACHLASHLPCRVLAFDLMPAFLADARARVHIRHLGEQVGVVLADGNHLPLPAAACDAAACIGAATIVGLPDALIELARIVKPGAPVAVSDALLRDGVAPASLPQELAGLLDLPSYLHEMQSAGLRIDSTHRHPLQDWVDYFAPVRRTAGQAEAAGDSDFARTLRTTVDTEWQAAQTTLNYVTILAFRV